MLTRTAWTVLIVPPISLLLLCLLGLVLDLRRRISRVLVLFGLGGLLLLALPITSQLALSVLESGNAGVSGAEAPGAIVILSGDMAHTASGFADGPATLERLRMGAELWRQPNCPCL